MSPNMVLLNGTIRAISSHIHQENGHARRVLLFFLRAVTLDHITSPDQYVLHIPPYLYNFARQCEVGDCIIIKIDPVLLIRIV